jgi:hypothetical protein
VSTCSPTPVGSQARLALELLQHYDQFIETEDFNWVDLMVWRLTREGYLLPPAVLGLAARIAHQRLLGSGARNKQSSVIKKYSKDLAMRTMAGNIGLDKGRGVKAPIKAAAREEGVSTGEKKSGRAVVNAHCM